MKPDVFTEHLKVACGQRLVSVILYGSAAAGDHTGKRSDYNILVVLDRLGVEELKALSKPTRAWVKAGNQPPLVFTREGFARSADVFPLEIADMRDSHQVLFGEDVVSALSVPGTEVRWELAHELKGKLMQLRSRYLLVEGNSRQVTELMVRSLSTFLVLCRGALRLYQPHVPAKKMEALAELAKHVPIQTDVFETIAHLKAGRRLAGVVPEALFARYVHMIEVVVNAVEALLHPQRS